MTSANDRRLLQTEALLLLRAIDGDRQAFTTLAGMLARPALALAYRILGDRSLAEDAVQDALTRLWRERAQFDPDRGRFSAWWHRLLVNCALDSRRRLKVVVPLDEASAVADDAPTAQTISEAASIAGHVQIAMEALPPRQRAALALFYKDDLSMAEIATTLETTEKAVEGLLGRGRLALKERLAHLEGEW